ncbi:MAG: beta-galactosidase trimerization domain-containing protein [Verrucomicrobiae bacterium]|nr:beta-galactosidase trimerization domain-containing protein [Verrucomicrobiae bacterium]
MKKMMILAAALIFSMGIQPAIGDEAKITRKRVAVFHEPGFPSRSPRSVEWYQRTLTEAGLEVKLIGVRELKDARRFSSRRFDTLIMATGGNFPREAEEAIGMFMRGGGTIVVDESIAGVQNPPEEVVKESSLLREDYLKGVNIEKYLDFCHQQRPLAGNIFERSAEEGKWIPEVTFFSGMKTAGPFLNEFEFETWPNPWGVSSSYRRPFSEDLVQNAELAKAGLLEGFPKAAPVTVTLDSDLAGEGAQAGGKGREAAFTFPVTREKGCQRLTFFGSAGVADMSQKAPEYANDVLLPVYVFKSPSGYKYPAFEKCGLNQKDCDSDFYIYRCHSRLKNGYTLVHFGVVGAHLLKSAHARQVLLGSLRLAEAALPGERSRQYVDHCLQMEEKLSEYCGKSVGLMAGLERAARMDHYRGREKKRDATLALLREQRSRFESICEDGERLRLAKWEQGERGDEERVKFSDRCNRAVKDLDGIGGRYGDCLMDGPVCPPSGKIKNRFKRLCARMDFISPSGIGRLKELYPLARELGFEGMPLYFNQVGSFRKLDMLGGFGQPTGYRLCMFNSNPFKDEFEMGIFNPATGTVANSRFRWFETAESWKRYEKDEGWILNKLNERNDVKWVLALEERNMQWTMWDQRTEKRFHEYLRRIHGDIEALNRQWMTKYGGFEEIKLPMKRPEGQAEHALWEDWTRYREIYVLEEEIKPICNLIKKHAPKLYLQAFGSYCGQENFPASGINYYEYGKALDLNTLEMGSSEPLRDEVMTSDIAGFFSKNLTSEWGAFYSTHTPALHADKMDKLKERMWNGVGWGQIGWCSFMGSKAGWHYSNFIDADNRVLPLGWAMKELHRDFGKIGRVILDGVRDEPPVRIVYSPTTHRHSCWPGVEANKSFDEVCGFYRAFQQSHIQSRALDEGAILDGHLKPSCKVLVAPGMTYMNDRVMTKVIEYLKGGGGVLMTADSGRYDQYGRRRDGLLALAGVAVKGVKIPTVNVKGAHFVCHGMGTSQVVGLEPLFPNETDTLLKYESGEAAVTATRVGKGVLVVIGMPFGREYYSEWRWKPATALKVLDSILAPMGLEKEYECSDREIVVRPWKHEGKRYLAVTNPTRKEMEPTQSPGGQFPFKMPALATGFKLGVKGAWKVRDVALAMEIPSRFDGEYTQMEGMVGNPGGVVYELREDRESKKIKVAERKENGATSETKREDPKEKDKIETRVCATDEKKHHSMPFEGQFFEQDGRIRIGNYLIRMDVDSGNRTWGGDLYLQIDNGTEKIRKICRTGETVVYPFIDKSVKVVCENASSVMPIGIKCRMTEERPIEINSACVVREELFEGQKSVVMENGEIWLRLLPELGARVIEMGYRRDGVNHLYDDRKLVNQGKAGTQGGGFTNYGGIEENCRAMPGPFWNQVFEHEVVTNTPECAVVKIKRSKPLEWNYANQGGVVSLEKTYVLRKGESRVQVKARLYNEKNIKDAVRYRLRPLLAVGGDANASDVHLVSTKEGIKMAPFRLGNVASYANVGTWSAFVDQEKRKAFVTTFKSQDMAEVYTYMGEKSYNLELMTVLKEAEPGQCVEFEYEMGLLQGIRGLGGVGWDIGVNLDLSGNGRYGRNEKVRVEVELSAFKETGVNVKVGVLKGESPVAEIGEMKMKVSAGSPARKNLEWFTGKLEDGSYQVVAQVTDPGGKVLVKAMRPLVVDEAQRVSMAGQIEQLRKRLEGMRKEYESNKNEALRERIVRFALLLNELEEAASKGDSGKMDEIRKAIATLSK